MQSRFPIAVGAGLVSGLLFLAAATGQMASLMTLVFLAPLPIVIAGFSWGWILAAIAALTAFGFLTLVGSITAGLFHLCLFGLPITVSVYYLLLNREYTTPSGATDVEWYPLGRVLFGLAIVSETLNLHEGEIAVESQLGEGTTVRIWLPQASSHTGG